MARLAIVDSALSLVVYSGCRGVPNREPLPDSDCRKCERGASPHSPTHYRHDASVVPYIPYVPSTTRTIASDYVR